MEQILITEPRPAFIWCYDFGKIEGYQRISAREARNFQGERAGPVLFENRLMPNALGWVKDGHGFRRLALSGRGVLDIVFCVKGFSLDIVKRNQSDVLKLLFMPDHYGYHAAVKFMEALKRQAAKSIYANLVGLEGRNFPQDHELDFYNLGETFKRTFPLANEEVADEPSLICFSTEGLYERFE